MKGERFVANNNFSEINRVLKKKKYNKTKKKERNPKFRPLDQHILIQLLESPSAGKHIPKKEHEPTTKPKYYKHNTTK